MKPTTYMAATAILLLAVTAAYTAYVGAKHNREMQENRIVLCYEHSECYR